MAVERWEDGREHIERGHPLSYQITKVYMGWELRAEQTSCVRLFSHHRREEERNGRIQAYDQQKVNNPRSHPRRAKHAEVTETGRSVAGANFYQISEGANREKVHERWTRNVEGGAEQPWKSSYWKSYHI
jgi:hypothetical protein